eukprot:GHVU01051963.1.p1 GENE.GHVU01051963.1~~GHVU01051963.1.p1  ORF type:complete len:446 (-),score=52.66 GHVU01051963.1:1419-2756(-)
MPAPTSIEDVKYHPNIPLDDDDDLDIKVKILPSISALPVIREEDTPTYTLRRRKKLKEPQKAEEEDFDSVDAVDFGNSSPETKNENNRMNGDHDYPYTPYSGSPEKSDPEKSLDLSGSTDNSGIPAFPDLSNSTLDTSGFSQEIPRSTVYTSSPLTGQVPTPNGRPVILREKRPILTEDPLLSEEEVLRMRLFYQKQGSRIVVGESIADLYFGTVLDKIKGQVPKSPPVHTGVPVFVLHPFGEDSEFMKLKLIIAERVTGFALWHDDLERASDYSAMFPNFHCFFLSSDRSQLIGMLFHSKDAGLDFLSQYRRFAPTLKCGTETLKRLKKENKRESATLDRPPKSDPSTPTTLDRKQKSETMDNRKRKVRNSTGSLQTLRSDKKAKNSPKRKERLRKDQISSPSGFTHVTKVQPNDQRLSVTFDELMDLDVSRLSDSFRERLNTS